jgi:ribosome-associated heat shock protein Hsp15
MRGKGAGRFSVNHALPSDEPAMDAAAAERQRIDRWLWHARLVRTRSAAAALAAAGYVRINGARIEAPGRMVRLGDIITVALDHAVRVLKVRGFTERRGPPNCGQDLYEELG